VIRKDMNAAFAGRHDVLMDALAEEIDAGSSARQPVAVNEHVRAAHVPAIARRASAAPEPTRVCRSRANAQWLAALDDFRNWLIQEAA